MLIRDEHTKTYLVLTALHPDGMGAVFLERIRRDRRTRERSGNQYTTRGLWEKWDLKEMEKRKGASVMLKHTLIRIVLIRAEGALSFEEGTTLWPCLK